MYRVTLPIYLDGTRYGIEFMKSVGYTDNDRIASLLNAKGFKVEEVTEDMPISQLNADTARKAALAAAMNPKAPEAPPEPENPAPPPEAPKAPEAPPITQEEPEKPDIWAQGDGNEPPKATKRGRPPKTEG